MDQDRYIPVFDPEYDTFVSVRSRSMILFNAICTIGYRVKMSEHCLDEDIPTVLTISRIPIPDLRHLTCRAQEINQCHNPKQESELSRIRPSDANRGLLLR